MSKISKKLWLYFAVTLLIFSVIIGGIFMLLFRNYTFSIHKKELESRGNTIAQTLSAYMNTGGGHGMMGGYGAYLRFIGDIAGTDVWIVDSDLNLLTSGFGHSMMGSYTYKDLPQNAEQLVDEVFTGKTAFSEDFSALLSETSLTVGVPIKSGDDIIGALLLHSPVHGTDDAVKQGFILLGASMLAALIIALGLSIFLAKSFTDPIVHKEAMDALKNEQLRRDFIANISHELRTPVTVIRGSLEAICDKVVTEPRMIEEYHNQMLEEAKFMGRLVGDLPDLSKLQNPDFVIEKQEISICDVLTDVTRSIEQLAIGKNIRIVLHKQSENCIVNGDYGRLRQMLMIVLDNAVKFSPESSTVEISFVNKQITITDSGIGISKEHLPHIFDKFYMSRTEENKQGSGLGLAIAKQIADRHGIVLTAESSEGTGAVFTFKLPLKENEKNTVLP